MVVRADLRSTTRSVRSLDGRWRIANSPVQCRYCVAGMATIHGLKVLATAPYEPIGWTKCLDCCYNDDCLSRATEAQDVALLPDVDQALAAVLHQLGINT